MTQSKALRIFFIFDLHRERGLVNSVPFVCPLVPSFVIENYGTVQRFFESFARKGLYGKTVAFFEEVNVPLSY